MTKLLIILLCGGALAELAASPADPPLLIDSHRLRASRRRQLIAAKRGA